MTNADWIRLVSEGVDLRVVMNKAGAAVFNGAKEYLGRIDGRAAAQALIDALRKLGK